ncbi:retron St85 family effector protein [Vibrio fluvialis]|nr:retron St85 family effector protein [Vibrio fluvialis]
MIKTLLSDSQLTDIAHVIRDEIYTPVNQSKRTVFLCGADIKDRTTGRSKMASVFQNQQSRIKYELLYPESLFDDLLAGQGQHSLLELENILANSVDAIVLFPESPGSFAELGAFSSNPNLVNKLICISNKRFEHKRSFINYGPNRLIKASQTGKVLHEDYTLIDDPSESKKLFRRVSDCITKIQKSSPTPKNITNILEAENFILPCIYLIEGAKFNVLSSLLEKATSQSKKLANIATQSALTRLQNSRLIMNSTEGFTMTRQGEQFVTSNFRESSMDSVRVEILNFQNRRKSIIDRARMLKHL